MKTGAATFCLALGVAAFLLATANGRAQPIPAGQAKDFTSSTYFEPPHEQQVKMKLSGAEAVPLAGFMWDVKQLHIETFDESGKLEMVVRAPQCSYALGGVASSPGRLELQAGDGKFRVSGVGFLWRQTESLLIISNDVHSVVEMPAGQGSLL